MVSDVQKKTVGVSTVCGLSKQAVSSQTSPICGLDFFSFSMSQSRWSGKIWFMVTWNQGRIWKREIL